MGRPLHAEINILAFRPVRPGDVRATSTSTSQSMLDLGPHQDELHLRQERRRRAASAGTPALSGMRCFFIKEARRGEAPRSPGEPPSCRLYSSCRRRALADLRRADEHRLDVDVATRAERSVRLVGATPCMNSGREYLFRDDLGARAHCRRHAVGQNRGRKVARHGGPGEPTSPWWAPVTDADDVTGVDAPSEGCSAAEALGRPVWPQAVGGIQGGIDARSNKGIKSRYHVLDFLFASPLPARKTPRIHSLLNRAIWEIMRSMSESRSGCCQHTRITDRHWKHGAKLTMLQWEGAVQIAALVEHHARAPNASSATPRRSRLSFTGAPPPANQLPLDHTLARTTCGHIVGVRTRSPPISLGKSANNGNFGRVGYLRSPRADPLTKDNDSFMSERGTTTVATSASTKSSSRVFCRRSRSIASTIPRSSRSRPPAASSPKATLSCVTSR